MAHVDELLHQVWLHPEDDQVRLVLADALLATGDPRGELIHLQLRSPKHQAVRIMRLLQAHGLTWLGALRGAVLPISYERGFLASCRLYDTTNVAGVDEWSTVHTIEVGVADATLLADPVMRSLRCATNLADPALAQLLGAPHAIKLERLGVAQPWTSLPALYDRLEALPALAAVELDDPLPLVLRRGSDDRLSVIEAEYNSMLVDVLRRLPIDVLTRLAVTEVPDDCMESLQGLASRQRRLISLELVPYAPIYNY